jgi:hypothetical protein
LERLSQKLARKQAAGDVALRFRQTNGRWKLHVDHARPDDETFAHDGRKVLLLHRAAADALNERTLTVRDTKSGPRLKLRSNAEGG